MTEDEMVGWYHWLSLCRLQELVMDRGDWRTEVHGVVKSQIWLSDWTELSTSPKTCLQDSIRHQCTEAVFWHQFQGQRGEPRAEICFYSYWLHFLQTNKQTTSWKWGGKPQQSKKQVYHFNYEQFYFNLEITFWFSCFSVFNSFDSAANGSNSSVLGTNKWQLEGWNSAIIVFWSSDVFKIEN